MMNDQTAKADAGKLRLTLVPRGIIRAIARVRMFGQKNTRMVERKTGNVSKSNDTEMPHFVIFSPTLTIRKDLTKKADYRIYGIWLRTLHS